MTLELGGRLGVGAPLLALAALVSVPVTDHAGEWLAERVAVTPLVARHEQLGDGLLPWVAALFLLSVGSYVWFRSRDAVGHVAMGVITVLALPAGVPSVVQVYRIGDSGARAAWVGNFSAEPR